MRDYVSVRKWVWGIYLSLRERSCGDTRGARTGEGARIELNALDTTILTSPVIFTGEVAGRIAVSRWGFCDHITTARAPSPAGCAFLILEPRRYFPKARSLAEYD